jgi:hypothetical protein
VREVLRVVGVASSGREHVVVTAGKCAGLNRCLGIYARDEHSRKAGFAHALKNDRTVIVELTKL